VCALVPSAYTPELILAYDAINGNLHHNSQLHPQSAVNTLAAPTCNRGMKDAGLNQISAAQREFVTRGLPA